MADEIIYPERLIEEFASDRGAILIGAGLSKGSGLPLWNDLLEPFRQEIPGVPENDISPDLLAQYYANKSQSAEADLLDNITSKLTKVTIKPNQIHRELVKLPCKYIFTTNFDQLIENALSDANIEYESIVDNSTIGIALRTNKRIVIKLHGDIKTPRSIVLTSKHYEEYFEKRRSLVTLLKAKMFENRFLFLGYSGRDSNIRSILSEINREQENLNSCMFVVQFDPPKYEIQEWERLHVNVIKLGAVDSDKQTVCVASWLKEFRKRIQIKKVEFATQKHTLTSVQKRSGQIVDSISKLTEEIIKQGGDISTSSIAISGIIFNRHGEVLLEKRGKTRDERGKLEGTGGKWDNESGPHERLYQRIAEETGLYPDDVIIDQYFETFKINFIDIQSQKPITWYVCTYLCRHVGNNMPINNQPERVIGIEWLDIKKLIQIANSDNASESLSLHTIEFAKAYSKKIGTKPYFKTEDYQDNIYEYSKTTTYL